jgi:hypothetical protein
MERDALYRRRSSEGAWTALLEACEIILCRSLIAEQTGVY